MTPKKIKDWKPTIIVLLILLLIGGTQSYLYSPLTPRAASIAHFKINPKLLDKVNPSPNSVTSQNETTFKTEEQILETYGRLELVRLTDNTMLRGAVIKQGDDFIMVETPSGVRKVMTDTIDTVEIIR